MQLSPKLSSAASWSISQIDGCGWTALANSSTVASAHMAAVSSPASSVARSATACAPSSSHVSASESSRTKPAVSPSDALRPFAAARNVPVRTFLPLRAACSAVMPTETASGLV